MGFDALLASTDRAAMDHLGGVVGYTPGRGLSVSVQGIFDSAYVDVNLGQAGVSSTGPAVFLRLADLPSDPSDDDPRITISGVEYEVREAKPDGIGGVVLLLHVA